jgi:hypothetical membrane protein
MTSTNQTVPAKWILILSGLIALMEIMVSATLCFAPETMADTIDISAKGVGYIMSMWAARQFALGVIFAFATIKRSIPMLTISYLFFLVMFIGDLVIGISQKENGTIIAAVVMCALSAVVLFFLNKKK